MDKALLKNVDENKKGKTGKTKKAKQSEDATDQCGCTIV
jgi:hypothetical protein